MTFLIYMQYDLSGRASCVYSQTKPNITPCAFAASVSIQLCCLRPRLLETMVFVPSLICILLFWATKC